MSLPFVPIAVAPTGEQAEPGRTASDPGGDVDGGGVGCGVGTATTGGGEDVAVVGTAEVGGPTGDVADGEPKGAGVTEASVTSEQVCSTPAIARRSAADTPRAYATFTATWRAT